MVKTTWFCISCLLVCVFSSNAQASDEQIIRFYKVNKHEQASRIRIYSSANKTPGCHNFLKKTRVFKIVQFGYQSCSVYTKTKCDADSIVRATHHKQEKATEILSEGLAWKLESEHKRGLKIGSWHCT